MHLPFILAFLEGIFLRTSSSIANGRHLAAARIMAGLKQTELAMLAGLHVHSLKRLERMGTIPKGWAIERLQKAL